MTSRDRLNNLNSYKDSHGSIFGGILTIICYLSTISYLITETNKMMRGEYDNYNIQTRPNSFQDGYN